MTNEKHGIDELLSQIPSDLEYSFTIQKLGYHYSCYLKVIAGSKTVKFNGSSNDLDVALRAVSDKLQDFLETHFVEITA